MKTSYFIFRIFHENYEYPSVYIEYNGNSKKKKNNPTNTLERLQVIMGSTDSEEEGDMGEMHDWTN